MTQRLYPYILILACLTLAACDHAEPTTITELEDAGDLSTINEGRIIEAFQEIESLFTLGYSPSSGLKSPGWQSLAKAQADTTTFTGIHNPTDNLNYIATLQYREPQGVPLWRVRLQYGITTATQSSNPALVTVNLDFTTFATMDGFLTNVALGNIAYLKDATNLSTSFSAAESWRVVVATADSDNGGARLDFANTSSREQVNIRNPVITVNANNTATVRDSDSSGLLRTRYYDDDFVLNTDGSFTGTITRELINGGYPNGSTWSCSQTMVVGQNYGPVRISVQRGGDGVIIRQNSEYDDGPSFNCVDSYY
jgi:hypothetical protein